MIHTLIDYYNDITNSIILKYNNFFEVFKSVLEKSKNISGVCDHCSGFDDTRQLLKVSFKNIIKIIFRLFQNQEGILFSR